MKPATLSFLFVLLFMGVSIRAEEYEFKAGNDVRQLVNYPVEVKMHLLANMRGHLQSLADVQEALSKGQYADAADIADNRLGMNSGAAAGCRPESPHQMVGLMSESPHLDHQMAQLMPEEMRKLGQNMHRAANEFANMARQAAKSGDVVPAQAALGKVMQQCVACHSAYRIN